MITLSIDKITNKAKKVLIYADGKLVDKLIIDQSITSVYLPKNKQVKLVITDVYSVCLAMIKYVFTYLNGVSNHQTFPFNKQEIILISSPRHDMALHIGEKQSKLLGEVTYQYERCYSKKGYFFAAVIFIVLLLSMYSMFMLLTHSS